MLYTEKGLDRAKRKQGDQRGGHCSCRGEEVVAGTRVRAAEQRAVGRFGTYFTNQANLSS